MIGIIKSNGKYITLQKNINLIYLEWLLITK
mgnify:CR=1 FL=1